MIVCCGEALIDMVRVPVPGEGEGFVPLPGGSTYNTAIAIGRLGAPVQFLGRFSTDFFGEILLRRLRENNVGDDTVIRCALNTTLAFVKVEAGKEPRYVFYTEGTADRSLSMEDVSAALPAHTTCIVFGSISMTMEPIASAIESLVFANAANVVVSLDPNIRPFMIKDRGAYVRRFEQWAAASTICKTSSADCAFIYPRLKPEEALRKILSLGPRLAISTLGDQGAEAMLRKDDGAVIRTAAPVVDLPVVDTIGAGDTFHGAFLSRLELQGKMSHSAIAGLSETELHDALAFANRAASLVCSRRGADPPAMAEVLDLAREQ